MGWIADLLKDIPLSSVLREKVSEAQAKQAALETEVAVLKDKLYETQRENHKLLKENEGLKDEINRLTHAGDLDETKRAILKALTLHKESLYSDDLESLLGLERVHIKYHLHELARQGYIQVSRPKSNRPEMWRLLQKGREFLVRNKLI